MDSAKERRRKRREQFRNKYGITPEMYDDMLDFQGGVCAICLKPPTEFARLAVDHDHDTGRIRGLLCNLCNTAIGMMEDNSDRLRRAAQYVESEHQWDSLTSWQPSPMSGP